MRADIATRFATEADIICYDAPVLILVCTEKERFGNINLLDSVLAAENMFLKAYELGLGTCYMGFVSFLCAKPEVLHKLGVPENMQMTVPFVLGHPKAKQGAGKRNKPSVLQWLK